MTRFCRYILGRLFLWGLVRAVRKDREFMESLLGLRPMPAKKWWRA